MSKIVLHSMAHRGDVFPYVPIASELARRGHDVVYVVPREFHPLFDAEPFRCAHSGTDFGPAALDAHGAYIARWGMRLGGGALLPLYFGRFTVPHLSELFAAVDAEVQDADLLFSHPAAAVIGAMSSELRRVPLMVGDLFPMLVPTSTAPPSGMPALGPRANRALWRLGRSGLVGPLTSRRKFTEFRSSLGLDTPPGWNVIDARLGPLGNLGLNSPHYVTPAPDWPADYRLTGFTFWDGPDGGFVSDDIASFLDDGAPPIIVTLGTSGASARPEVFGQVAATLDELGARGMFLTSNDEVTERVRATLDPRHGIWPFAPLRPLLHRATAIVHSGAHGTNALALAAGLPSVIVPCMFDQAWHGRRQQELGTGVWVRRSRDLRAAIEHVLRDRAIRTAAERIASQLGEEDGTQAACNAIEASLATGRH